MTSILAIVGGVLAAVVSLAWWLGRTDRKLASGRWARALRIGRMTAGLSTSWLGARLRRWLASPQKRRRYDEARRKADAERVVQTMGQMKGAFMKLGQMLSFVSDAVPREFREALRSLQAEAPPMDFALLRDVAESELGRPLERVFARFDERPLASASIGQVHRARLASGHDVAVKIQYPGVAEAIASDLKNAGMLTRMARMLYPNLDTEPVIEELSARVMEELDYAHEAQNQKAFLAIYDGHPFIRIPKVYDDYSTKRVLTTEFISGRPFEELYRADAATRSHYGEILYRFVFGSIIRYGVFNGDPHPGNYLWDDDGRMVFLDFGCVKYFPEPMLNDWRELIRAHLAGQAEKFRERVVALSFLKPDADVDAQKVFDYFCFFYEPFDLDRVYEFTRAYANRSLGMVLKPAGEFAGMEKSFNMPKDFVFVNRIQWGVYSILGEMQARQNWHRVHRELVHDDAPQSELGRRDLEYRHAKLGALGLADVDVILRPEGLRRRQPAPGR